MKWYHAFAAMILVLSLSACGYTLTANNRHAPLVIAPEYRDLFLKSVDNPTLYDTIVAEVHSDLRDEFTRRGSIHWVHEDKATAFLHVKIKNFLTSTSITNSSDQTLKSKASMVLIAWITRKTDGHELWRGAVSFNENFTDDETSAQTDVIKHVCRKLADKLYEKY